MKLLQLCITTLSLTVSVMGTKSIRGGTYTATLDQVTSIATSRVLQDGVDNGSGSGGVDNGSGSGGVDSDTELPFDGDSGFDFEDGNDWDVSDSDSGDVIVTIELSDDELIKFANILTAKATECQSCDVTEVITNAFETYGIVSDDEQTPAALFAALYDESLEIFDEAKKTLTTRTGHNVCEYGASSGLCKGNEKSARMFDIWSAFTTEISKAEDLGLEPDMEEIAGGIEDRFGLDDDSLNWLLSENPAMLHDIESNYLVVKEKGIMKAFEVKVAEIELALNISLDVDVDIHGRKRRFLKELDEAVEETGITPEEMELAFRFMPPDHKSSLRDKIDRGKKQMHNQVVHGYLVEGYEETTDHEWNPKLNQTHPKGVYSIDPNGTLHFEPPDDFERYEEIVERVEVEMEIEHTSRRLEVKKYLVDTHAIKQKLVDHVALVHRELVDISDQSACPSTVFMGCFADNASNRDLALSLGGGFSVETCLNKCHDEGYDYAGLQAGSSCFCGDESYGKYGESRSCYAGTGGHLSNSIYKKIEYPNIDCVATEFEDLASNLLVASGTAVSAIDPLIKLLDAVEESTATLKTLKTMGTIIKVALFAGGKIPYIGPVLATAEKIVKPIVNLIQKAADKAQRLQTSVFDRWQNSLGKFSDVVDGFDSSFVGPIVGVATGLRFVSESQCFESIITELAGGNDILGTSDAILGSVKDYSQTLLDALVTLTSALASSAWTSIQNTLQSFMDGLKPTLDFLSPLKPLGELLKQSVTLPWFKLPYFTKKLGGGTCNSGYSIGSFKTCWEKENYYWGESLAVDFNNPFKMQRTCKSGGYSGRSFLLGGGCWNNNYWSHTRGFIWKWWRGPYCPSHYAVQYWRPWECTKNCPSDRSLSLGYCYKKTCNSGFWKSGTQSCTGNVRNQNSHTAKCDRYSHDAGSSKYLDWKGDCMQGCSNGDTWVLGACFPKAELKISVEGIANAFAAIFEFIEGLPIVSTILGVIDSIVGAILKPVTDYISKMIPIGMPDFPDLKLDILPVAFFDDFTFDLPALPEVTQLLDLPKKIISSLPGIPTKLTECGMDADCLLEEIGMDGVVSDIATSIEQVFDVFDFDTLKSQFLDIFTTITCTEWQDIKLPVESILSQIPFITDLDGMCDIEIPVCTAFDFSGAEQVLQEVKNLMLQLSQSDRRLADQGQTNAGLVFLNSVLGGALTPFSFQSSVALMLHFGRDKFRGANMKRWKVEGSLNLMKAKVTGETENGVKTEYQDAYRVAVKPELSFTIAPKINTCTGGLYLSFMPSFSLTVSSNKGNERMLREALGNARSTEGEGDKADGFKSDFAESIAIDNCFHFQGISSPFTVKYNQTNPLEEKICALKFGALSIANHGWIVGLFRLTADFRKELETDQSLGSSGHIAKEVANKPEAGCTQAAMKDLLESRTPSSWSSTVGFNAAWPCIKYWDKQRRVLGEFEAKIKELQELDITTKGMRHMWEEVIKKTQFPTSNFQAPIVSAINRIRDSPLNLTTDPGFNYGLSGTNPIQAGKLSFGIGLTASHPEYLTSLGVNFGFNTRTFTSGFTGDGLTSIDVGKLEFRHLADLSGGGGFGGMVNELKNNWVWGISLSAAYDQQIRVFDKLYPDICKEANSFDVTPPAPTQPPLDFIPEAPTQPPLVPPFDPMSTLVKYHDHSDCGPRGDDATVDLEQCLVGWRIKEEVHFVNWETCVATIDGCCYYAYTVYECTEDFNIPSNWRTPSGVNLQSFNYQSRFWNVRSSEDVGINEPSTVILNDLNQLFKIVAPLWSVGSSTTSCVSFESISSPGHFLRHSGYNLRVHKETNIELFKKDATFIVKKGLIDGSDGSNANGVVRSEWVSFESVNYPNMFIAHRGYTLSIKESDDSELHRKDATFRVVAKSFDPMSTLVQYHDYSNCGPRGDDATADLEQCLVGWHIKEEVHFVNWETCVATIDGCCYYAYTVYECT